MELHYRTLDNDSSSRAPLSRAPIIILHGIFGTSDNWQTFGKRLSEDYEIFLVDLRNHGNSPHSETFDYPSMADDLHEFIEQHALVEPVILGHSMGGKVAMFYATQHPEGFGKLIVVDIAPRAYPVHHQAVLEALGAVAIDEITDRDEAEAQMKPHVAERGVRQFLMKNLKRTDQNSFEWKLNLPVIRDNIENVGVAVDYSNPVEKPVLFIRGDQSDYIQEDDEPLIKKIFPQAQIKMIEGAGHWVHAEQPDTLYEVVTDFLEG